MAARKLPPVTPDRVALITDCTSEIRIMAALLQACSYAPSPQTNAIEWLSIRISNLCDHIEDATQ